MTASRSGRDRRAGGRGRAENLLDEVEGLRGDLESWAAKKVRKARRSLTAEERAVLEARRAVSRRIGFLSHFVPYAVVCLSLLVVAGLRPALFVAFVWGIPIAIHGFSALIAPDLRRRWTEDEVRRRVPAALTQSRRELEGRHARNLEHLSASIAHEIRNPITAAKSLLQQMGEDPHSPENVEYASVALQELGRVERSISHLLRYARDEAVQPERVVVADVARSAVETLRERAQHAGVAIHLDVREAGELEADPEQLRRVVINLVANAIDALEEEANPAPRIDIEAGRNLAGSEVWLRVRDNGPGVPPGREAELWAPFRTTKANGTGLGLATVRKIAEAHGGSAELEPSAGRGASFLVTLPATGSKRRPEARA